MTDKVIILVSDDQYINHVKSIAVNCVIQGKYDGDFAVICPEGSAAAKELKSYGWDVLEVKSEGFMMKFSIFSDYFKKYSRCLYLDCDVVVIDNLDKLFFLLDNGDLWMDTEDQTTLETFHRDPHPERHKDLYDYVKEVYPHVTKQTFNSAFILFNPQSIESGTDKMLSVIQKNIETINHPAWGGTDQQTINLLLWNNIKKIPNKLVSFWGLNEEVNEVDSEYRQYKKEDRPVAVHLSRWYAQWIEKKPDMAAYKLNHVDIPIHDLYKHNLAKFDELFKKTI